MHLRLNSIIFLFKLFKTFSFAYIRTCMHLLLDISKLFKAFSFAYVCACVCAPFTRYKSTRSTTLVQDDQVLVIFYVNSNFFPKKRILRLIKAVDNPRTLNKVLHTRPPAKIFFFPFNAIVSLWEKKIGKTLEKNYLL